MIIVVGGSGSGSGKTTLIRIILKFFPDRFTVLKITPNERFGEGIEENLKTLDIEGKDTYYYLHEGARKVYWIRGVFEKLEGFIEEVFSKGTGDVIVEGNSFLKFKKPDLIFFVEKDLDSSSKKDARFAKSAANYVIVNAEKGYVNNFKEFNVNLKSELDLQGQFSQELKTIIKSF